MEGIVSIANLKSDAICAKVSLKEALGASRGSSIAKIKGMPPKNFAALK